MSTISLSLPENASLWNRYTELEKEAPEFIDPRPAASWPHDGAISVEKLTIRYAVRLPLHSELG